MHVIASLSNFFSRRLFRLTERLVIWYQTRWMKEMFPSWFMELATWLEQFSHETCYICDQPNKVYGNFPDLTLHCSSLVTVLSFSPSTVKKGISKSSRTASSDTSKVVDAVIDGLISQRPQTRYPVGLDAKVSIFISLLPTFIADYLFRKRMNVKRWRVLNGVMSLFLK